jgi:hypothetical protein
MPSLSERPKYRRCESKKPLSRRTDRRRWADPTATIPQPLAKKVRTPTPPRPVQAPKRRDTKQRQPITADEHKKRWLLYGFAALGPVALVIVLAVVLIGGGSSSGKASGKAPNIDYAALPGLQKGPAPWKPEYALLPDRLRPLGLNALSAEALAFHIHQHLDVFVNGKSEPVPAFIGIDDGSFITELHTHNALGIIHVESATKQPYTLGQFFGVWGVRLSPRCVGGYCATPGKPLRTYLDGKLYSGNPDNLILQNHQVIAVVYGKPPTKIPSTYNFAAQGL